MASIGKNVFLLDLEPRPFRSYDDATAAIMSLLSAPAMLKVLLDGYLVLSTGDFHKYNLCSRILALPQEPFLRRLQAFDGLRYDGIMQTIELALGVDRSTAETQLWSASQNIVDIPGVYR